MTKYRGGKLEALVNDSSTKEIIMGKDPFKEMKSNSKRCKDLSSELDEMLNNNGSRTGELPEFRTGLLPEEPYRTGLTPEYGQSYANLPEKVFDMYLATKNIYREGSAIPSYDTKDEMSIADQCREFFAKHPDLENICENAYDKLELHLSKPDRQGKMMLTGVGRSKYSMRQMDAEIPSFHNEVFAALVPANKRAPLSVVKEVDQIGDLRVSYGREEMADIILNLYQNSGHNGLNKEECTKFFEKYPELEEVCKKALEGAIENAGDSIKRTVANRFTYTVADRFTYRDIMHYNGWDNGSRSFDERIADTINNITKSRKLALDEVEQDAKSIDFGHQQPIYPVYILRGRGLVVNE